SILKDHSFIRCFHLFIFLVQPTFCSALAIYVVIKEEIKERNRFSFRQEISVYSTTMPHRISCVQQQIYRMLGNRQHPCEAMSEKGPRLIHRYLKRSINPIKSSNASRSVSDLRSSAEYLLAPWINSGAHEPDSGRQSSIGETISLTFLYRLLSNNAFVDTPFVRSSPSLTYYVRATPNAIFKDLEEENEDKPAKVIQLSQKGCGLFSLLTAPKGKPASNKTLIPQVVKNTVVKANIQQPNTKKSSSNQNNFKVKKPTSDKSHNESSSDEEDATIDFFGLATSEDLPDNSTGDNPTELLDSTLSSDDLLHKSNTKVSLTKHTEDHTIHSSSSINSDASVNGHSSKTLTSNVINLPKEEILLKNKAEVGPKLPIPEQEYNVDLEGNVAFDEKAIEYLCGKRGIKRKEIDEADIIEINGEDIKPDEREWLVKALTEESVHRPVSMQSGGINSQSKKKHQITYLAHQAKAMELELKNQWSQNRMARKQTKSKYGF
ncbi:Proline-rich protein PRCC, partial [Cyphomyrmex costatus]